VSKFLEVTNEIAARKAINADYYATVGDYGAVGDGVADDTAAILAAIAAVQAKGGGTVMLDCKDMKITGDIHVPGTVNLIGSGGGHGCLRSRFVCSGSSARVRFGDGTGRESRGGLSGGFTIFGNGEGSPMGLLFVNRTVQRTFQNIEVRGGAGVGILIEQAQNNTFISVDAIDNTGPCLVLDRGTGGNVFLRCEIATSTEYCLLIRETYRSDDADRKRPGLPNEASNNIFQGCIFENFSQQSYDGIIKITAGDHNTFDSCVIACGRGTLLDGHNLQVSGGLTEVIVRNSLFNGGGDYGAINVSSGAVARFYNNNRLRSCTTGWTVDGSGRCVILGDPCFASTTTPFNAINAANQSTSFYVTQNTPQQILIDESVFGVYAKRFQRKSEAGTGYRMQITPDGALQYGDGTGFTALATMDFNATSADIRFTSLRVTKRFARQSASQTLSANGPVLVDCLNGSAHNITLSANATSMSFTNAVIDLEMTVTIIQDTTGGWTYAWPSNCRFAGGVAPSDATASTRTTVSFRYSSTVARWHEVSRAVAVPNA
jgi:hypothetical protein